MSPEHPPQITSRLAAPVAPRLLDAIAHRQPFRTRMSSNPMTAVTLSKQR